MKTNTSLPTNAIDSGLVRTMAYGHAIRGRALLALALLGCCGLASAAENGQRALLVVAHGASRGNWNQRVIEMIDRVKWSGPKGVAFLAGDEDRTLERVAARLDQPDVRQIVVVPLFVSSFSGHFEEIRYYTGQRADLPDHAERKPLKTKAPLVMTSAMDGHPIVSLILIEQSALLITNSVRTTLLLVAHGPNEDADNAQWLAHLRAHSTRLRDHYGLQRSEALTLRDDAPEPVRKAATEALRAEVRTAGADSQVIVLPVLISVGHVQQEIRRRLEGLDYIMADGGLANHALSTEWIRQQASEAVSPAPLQSASQTRPVTPKD